jgi:hypothetical protein
MGHIVNYSPTNATTFTLDDQLMYFGDDGSTFLKRPMSQEAKWTEDFVCVDDLCTEFLVSGVTITYPTTTTTTTAYPYVAVMTFVETYSNFIPTIPAGPQEGQFRNIEYTIQLAPSVLPGYSISLHLDFLTNFIISGASANQGIANMTVRKNSNQVYYQSIQQTTVGNNNIANNANVTIGNGDTISVVLENQAFRSVVAGNGVKSSTTLTPTINSVTPNGSIPSIVPTSMTNSVQKP